MDKVFVVQNGSDLLLAVFKTKAQASRFIKNIGKKLWGEHWKIRPIKMNEVDAWLVEQAPKQQAAQETEDV